MSNDFPGDEPTRAYRPFEEEEATRLERSVPTYDPSREPAPANPYVDEQVTGEEPVHKRGIAAQLVTVGLICTFLGLGLGWLLFGGLGGSTADDPEETTTTSAEVTTTSERPTTTTSDEDATTTTQRATTTTTRPATTTTTQRATTTTTQRATTTTTRPATTTTSEAGLEDATS